MRKAFAALLLSPIMLHAQANSPAKTQSSSDAYTLQAKLTMPEELATPEISDFDGVPAASPLRVTTGVVAPQITHTVDVMADNDYMWRFTGKDKTVVVSLVVDKSGKPTDLKISKSAGTELDENVLNAVAQYRFKPGTLNNQPTEVPVNLEVIVKAPTK